jgi:hypothetical protein
MLSVALGVVPIKEADAAGCKNSNGQNSSGGNTCSSVNQNVGMNVVTLEPVPLLAQ